MKNVNVENWINAASEAVTKSSQEKYPKTECNHMKLRFTKGRKYYKVIIETLEGGHTSVYCFISEEGNIYKANTWNAAAKGIRSTIEKKPANTVGASGAWLYR